MTDRYTIELHELLENPETKALLDEALSTYPMYIPENERNFSIIPTREELNQKIYNRYRFYNIGSETIARFLFNLKASMELIMPYYYQQFKALDILNNVEDLFGNIDITETYEEESTGTRKDIASGTSNSTTSSEGTAEANTNGTGRMVKNNTPQSQLNVTSIDGITAASEIEWSENDTNSTSSSNDSSTSSSSANNTNDSESTGLIKHTLNRKGNQGVNTYAHDLKELSEMFRNLEEEIVNHDEIANCFMLVW